MIEKLFPLKTASEAEPSLLRNNPCVHFDDGELHALVSGSIAALPLRRPVMPGSVPGAPAQATTPDLIAEGKRFIGADKNFKSYLVADGLSPLSVTVTGAGGNMGMK